MTSSENAFINSVRELLPWSQTHTGDMPAKVYAIDASPYEPQGFAVVDIVSLEDMGTLFSLASLHGVSVTVRGAGTALSGQATPSGVAVRLVGDSWKGIEVLEGGVLVKARCCVKGAEINAALAPYGRFVNSDPSSIASATIGGMAANNAAGLSCTVENNIYHRLRSMEFMLADGTFVDTADPASVKRFRSSHAGLLSEISSLRSELLSSEEDAEKVRRKFLIRNTCGYSLNAFTDFDDPVEILMHLLIGSEGTLGLIYSVTLETSPVKPRRATTMVSFTSLDSAMEAVVRMRTSLEMYACEFLDDVSLRCLALLPGFPEDLKPRGEVSDDCALLLEVRAEDDDGLAGKTALVDGILREYDLKVGPAFVTDPAECERLWDIRRALFPALAGTRLPTEYAYVEDYCVPIASLPKVCHRLVDVMRSVGSTRSGINGHALHGNLHCTIPIEISRPGEIEKLQVVIDKAADIILEHDGSLKAEHGTGRAVAPYVRREWGDFLYGIMRRTKELLDPASILNRGVLLNEDPMGHLSNIKYIAEVGAGLDLCVDCGFCEAVCPSAKSGYSPRQRIYAMRAIRGFLAAGDTERAGRWEAEFRKSGVDLCAVDGLCSTRCPLAINVAEAMKELRRQYLGGMRKSAAEFVRTHMGAAVRSASLLLDAGSAVHGMIGHEAAVKSGHLAGRITGMTLPDFREVRLCGGSRVPSAHHAARERIVYFPSCAVRSMGYADEEGRKIEPLMDVALRLIEKAGFDAVIPKDARKLCCGKAFESKGMKDQADAAAKELETALLEASEGGRWPVMCDTSPCLDRMRRTMDDRLRMYEPVEFTLLFLTERLAFSRRHRRVAVHPTCSTRTLGLAEKMREVALMCSEEVIMPEGVFCCGFSGDRGFTHPSLNAGALAGLSAKLEGCEAGYSTSRTCEVGLTLHGGKFYSSLLYLIDECTEALPRRGGA
ncbi:MAG: FAD-binding oxidoreductase [Mailhella sp.]|nr:FAD-binding oxidoreductase [Mailhella sp.]